MIPRPVSFSRCRLGGLIVRDALKMPNSHCQMAARIRDERSDSISTAPRSSHLQLLPAETDSMPESPYGLTRTQFRHYGKETIDYIVNYLENIHKRHVFPNVEPGYLKNSIPREAPQRPESWEPVMNDFENLIMPGVAHWQNPRFHAYYPAGNSYPPILAELLGDSLGCVGFSWSSCQAMIELEIVMLDWFGKMMGLPEAFLSEGGRGGGVFQGSASDCTFVALLAARYALMKDLVVRYPLIDGGQLLSKLVTYCSRDAHSSEKASGIEMFCNPFLRVKQRLTNHCRMFSSSSWRIIFELLRSFFGEYSFYFDCADTVYRTSTKPPKWHEMIAIYVCVMILLGRKYHEWRAKKIKREKRLKEYRNIVQDISSHSKSLKNIEHSVENLSLDMFHLKRILAQDPSRNQLRRRIEFAGDLAEVRIPTAQDLLRSISSYPRSE